MSQRQLSALDELLAQADRALRNLFSAARPSRPNPGAGEVHPRLDERQRAQAAALMRVNHAGEIAAQALYHGQALVARDPRVRAGLDQAAVEETDHLAWCRERLEELGGRTSRLDPLWYAGSFAIGALAGLAGDRWSLGFVEETERQVVEHLEGHLARLPAEDARTRAILEQMRSDERAHGDAAVDAGARPLPAPIRQLMKATAAVMTRTSYWF